MVSYSVWYIIICHGVCYGIRYVVGYVGGMVYIMVCGICIWCMIQYLYHYYQQHCLVYTLKMAAEILICATLISLVITIQYFYRKPIPCEYEQGAKHRVILRICKWRKSIKSIVFSHPQFPLVYTHTDAFTPSYWKTSSIYHKPPSPTHISLKDHLPLVKVNAIYA